MIKIPDNAPFAPGERENMEKLLSGLSPEQQMWLSGHLAPSNTVVTPVASSRPLTILYGTESGNCEELAAKSALMAKKRGFKAKTRNMAEVSVGDLAGIETLLVIVSTWGEGDPPETAVTFHKEFMAANFRLEKTKFSVCALGDTSYEDFCEIGKQVDRKLDELGATRLVDRQDCDVDFDDDHGAWLERVFVSLGEASSNGAAAPAPVAQPAVEYGKRNPFPSEVLEKVLLNGKGTKK
jgi:sulfite reductase (NADPH) flavoprotein alpha-component